MLGIKAISSINTYLAFKDSNKGRGRKSIVERSRPEQQITPPRFQTHLHGAVARQQKAKGPVPLAMAISDIAEKISEIENFMTKILREKESSCAGPSSMPLRPLSEEGVG